MTVEDRLRATTEALSGVMREVPPLTLPSQRPGRVSWPREPRRWRGWLIPLTAAVAVTAVAVTLVAVRDSRSAAPAPPAPVVNSAAAAFPRYYVQLDAYNAAPGYQRDALVGDSHTGKVLATVRPPAGLTFAGVAGAADDRTFVLDAASDAVGTQANHAARDTHTWYLLRIAPGTSRPSTLTRLPIAGPANSDQLDGLALSPDAGLLAVLYQTGVLGGSDGPFALRIFSLRTGKALRTWTAPAGKVYAYGAGDIDNDVDLTWTADGRTLAFMFSPFVWPDYERTLNVTRKSGSLLADSRAVLAIPGNQHNCVSLLLAPDGRTMVCGTVGNAADGCRQQEPEYDQYSTASRKLTRVLYRYQGICQGATAEVVWAGNGGTAIAVIETLNPGKARVVIDYKVGLLTPGKFTPLHVPVPAGYGFVTGELAF
jgi:hypothetical protein